MTDHNPDLPVYHQYNCPHGWPWKRFEVAGDWIAGTVRDSGPDCIHVDTINGLVAVKPPRRTAWQVSEVPPASCPTTSETSLGATGSTSGKEADGSGLG